MELTDSAIYSLELPTAPQVHNDYRQQQKASCSRPSLSCYVATALGLLTVILTGLLLHWWILCKGSSYPTCANSPSCPDLWMTYGDHCYYFSVDKNDWNSSLEFCLAKDSIFLCLGIIRKCFLKNILHDDFHWVGLRNNFGWRWEDGSALNFSRISSNSVVQTCGVINKNGLQASSCEVLLQWVCKKVRL